PPRGPGPQAQHHRGDVRRLRLAVHPVGVPGRGPPTGSAADPGAGRAHPGGRDRAARVVHRGGVHPPGVARHQPVGPPGVGHQEPAARAAAAALPHGPAGRGSGVPGPADPDRGPSRHDGHDTGVRVPPGRERARRAPALRGGAGTGRPRRARRQTHRAGGLPGEAGGGHRARQQAGSPAGQTATAEARPGHLAGGVLMTPQHAGTTVCGFPIERPVVLGSWETSRQPHRKRELMKPIADDIPVDRAWQEGRRIYVRCGYKTRLNQALRDLGAHWDSDQRARWVGVTKKPRVVELVRAHEQRITALEEVKQAGRWISIPYEAGEIRTQVKKQLGGVWDPQTKRWALPAGEAPAQAQALVAEWREKRRAAREAEEAAAREAEKAAREAAATAEQIRKAKKAAAAAARAERIVAESGRTPTGETTSYTVVSTRRMNRATALDQCTAVGTVIRLDDGRRAVVVRTGVEFVSAEYASSVCWHNDPDYVHGDAHWHL